MIREVELWCFMPDVPGSNGNGENKDGGDNEINGENGDDEIENGNDTEDEVGDDGKRFSDRFSSRDDAEFLLLGRPGLGSPSL
ncbi:MAG: hypothetical protein FWD64_03760 [Acidobacteriaceae bacterium]|nr:hypothetical protein [Acidobacteriaceae bacterium]